MKMKRRKVSMKAELSLFKARNEELLTILDNKIFSSKTYKMWQFYNRIKRRLFSAIFPFILLLLLITIVPIYIIYVALIWLVSSIASTLLGQYPKLHLTDTDRALDGVSFIIPTWNKGSLVKECINKLASIAANEAPQMKKEIIVVDNGSTDDTIKLLEELKIDIPLHLVKLDKNYSFAPAINIGVTHAKYNYVYLLNNDMFVQNGFLTELHTFASKLLKKGKDFYGIASQIFFFKKIPRRIESGKTYFLPHFGSLYIAHCVLDETLRNPSVTAYVGGGSSLIQKHVFNYLHRYDQRLFRPLYVEDVDTSFRAWKAGFGSYFLPSSTAIHHHQSSSKKLQRTPEYYINKNIVLLLLKNTSSFTQLMRHAILYPLRIAIDVKTVSYLHETFMSTFDILASRIDMLRYPSLISDKDIIDFPNYEKSHSI
jgi:GT2 family glycosyltransferase